jgi:CRISPR/Cas system-associated protein endoribonuclease Cas2
MNGKVGVSYLQKVKKEDFYYVLKKYKEIDDNISRTAYLQMLSAYMKEPAGQWVVPDIIARECWKVYITEYLHDAITTAFEEDKMLRLVFFFMRYVEDSNLYIEEPGNPSGKVHIIPYLYMYFRNPSMFTIKQKGKEVKPLMKPNKFMKIILALKLLEIDMNAPIYQNQASQGYDKKLIDISRLSGVNPMKTVYDYAMVTERQFGNVELFEGRYKPRQNIDSDSQILVTYLINDNYHSCFLRVLLLPLLTFRPPSFLGASPSSFAGLCTTTALFRPILSMTYFLRSS